MTNKEILQKMLDNVNETKLTSSRIIYDTYDVVYDGDTITGYSLCGQLEIILKKCQKEPTLRDKLLEYGFEGHAGKRYIKIFKDKFKIYVTIEKGYTKIGCSRLNQLPYYSGLFAITDNQVFDAIKLFEKWREEC